MIQPMPRELRRRPLVQLPPSTKESSKGRSGALDLNLVGSSDSKRPPGTSLVQSLPRKLHQTELGNPILGGSMNFKARRPPGALPRACAPPFCPETTTSLYINWIFFILCLNPKNLADLPVS